MNSKISVVIPTYNRPEQLSKVLKHILESDVEGFDSVEVIVVDDGSTKSPRDIVKSVEPPDPITLEYIYQENSGPAAARNNGFASATNEIVLFIDDDILVFPNLIRNHYNAHRDNPHSVIFGQSPFPEPHTITRAYLYLTGLNEKSIEKLRRSHSGKYIPMEIVASGNISFEKSLFGPNESVYAGELNIPVGEEYEVSFRLKQKKIPIYFMPETKGWHLQPTTISDSCEQNYKYGLGIAELAAKFPDVLNLGPLKHILEVNGPITKSDGIIVRGKKLLRRIILPSQIRRIILGFVNVGEKLGMPDVLLFPGYRLIVGTFFAAGIVEGKRRYRLS